MKTSSFIVSFGILILSSLLSNVTAQTASAKSKSPLSALNGAWNSADQNSIGTEHCLYYDGFVTDVGKDSTGAWRDIYSGTYEISGNIYKQKILYCSNSEYIGGSHWQEFKIKGDTLYLTFFKKVLDQSGNDVTSMFKPASGEYIRKYVRAKR